MKNNRVCIKCREDKGNDIEWKKLCLKCYKEQKMTEKEEENIDQFMEARRQAYADPWMINITIKNVSCYSRGTRRSMRRNPCDTSFLFSH